MKYSLIILSILFCEFTCVAQDQQPTQLKDSAVSIYSFTVDSIGSKQKIAISRFQKKRILIVNTAILDKNFSQLFELKKLQEQNKDNLIVLLFPSNDFNTEPANEKQIAAFLSSNGLPFIVAAKTHVKGKAIHPIYEWLTQKTKNGVKDSEVSGSFQKYMIDEDGQLEQVFTSTQRPYSNKEVKAAIEKTKK
jgi:glutathione peroxidase